MARDEWGEQCAQDGLTEQADDDAARVVLARPLALLVEEHLEQFREEGRLDLCERAQGPLGGAQPLHAQQDLV